MAGLSQIPAMYRKNLNGTLGPRSTNLKTLLLKWSLVNIYWKCAVPPECSRNLVKLGGNRTEIFPDRPETLCGKTETL
jgi:hypothetical protein